MLSRYRNLAILTGVLLLQLSLLAYQFRRNADVPLVRHGTIYVVAPIQRALRAVTDTVGGIWWGYIDLRGARRENQALVQELDQLRQEAQRLRNEVEQARRLQALVDFRQESPAATVVAPVISSSGTDTSQTVILGKGANAGIQHDMPVITPAGIVGKVLHVFPSTAQVLLVTDANSGVACLLENSRLHGVLKGRNQPLGRLAYVGTGEKIEIGEKVLTSGEDRIFPKGLPVGMVVAVRPGVDFQEIEVRPLAPLNRLEEVLVITKKPEIEPRQEVGAEVQPKKPELPGRASPPVPPPATAEAPQRPPQRVQPVAPSTAPPQPQQQVPPPAAQRPAQPARPATPPEAPPEPTGPETSPQPEAPAPPPQETTEQPSGELPPESVPNP